MNYIYPAIFKSESKGMYSVSFPDIEGCYTCGDDLNDAMYMAEDALCLCLYMLETEGKDIPKASEVNQIKHRDNEFVSLIKCDTDFYKRFYKSKAVKKTLSIPAWLNEAGTKQGLNFSQILQDGIKAELGR